MKVRFAVSPGIDMCDEHVLPDFIDALETLGFDTIWLSDIPMGSQIDPLVGLAFAAGRTRRLKLGANVVPIGRNPMLLAKELAQLDRLSNGRVLLNLVPGLDQRGEREAVGIGDSNRGRMIDEIIPLLRRWWSGESVDHHDDRFDFTSIEVRPLPQQDPLEIWLGGVGPLALRRAGRLADGWLGAGSRRTKPVSRSIRSPDQRPTPVASSTRSTRPEHPVRRDRPRPGHAAGTRSATQQCPDTPVRRLVERQFPGLHRRNFFTGDLPQFPVRIGLRQ